MPEVNHYRVLATRAMAKCVGYDPYFPEKSDVMVSAWAEALEHAHLTDERDIMMAVRVMYANYGDPGWRPTPRILVGTARECRRLRMEREENRQIEAEAKDKITLAEFKKRHPEVSFPSFGKEVPSE